MADKPGNIIYFLGIYPKISNSFIDTEIDELVRRGFSVRLAVLDEGQALLSGQKRDVLYLKKETTWGRVFASHCAMFFRHPLKYLGLVRNCVSGSLSFKLFVKYLWVAQHEWFTEDTIIYSHFAEAQSEIARMVSRIAGCPYLFKTHGTDHLTERKMKRIINDSLKTLVVNRELLRECTALCSGREGVVEYHPCGICLDKFIQGERQDPNRVVTICSQIERKGVDDLLRAVSLLKQDGISVSLDIVGDGPKKANSMKLSEELGIRENVVFHGSVHNSQVCSFYQQASIFVLASYAEGFPVTIMEAMASGLPVVATGVGDVPEMIVEGESGYVIEPGDVGALADRLSRILTDPDRGRSMGEKGKEISRRFDLGRQVDALCGWL